MIQNPGQRMRLSLEWASTQLISQKCIKVWTWINNTELKGKPFLWWRSMEWLIWFKTRPPSHPSRGSVPIFPSSLDFSVSNCSAQVDSATSSTGEGLGCVQALGCSALTQNDRLFKIVKLSGANRAGVQDIHLFGSSLDNIDPLNQTPGLRISWSTAQRGCDTAGATKMLPRSITIPVLHLLFQTHAKLRHKDQEPLNLPHFAT